VNDPRLDRGIARDPGGDAGVPFASGAVTGASLDERWMHEALRQARAAAGLGEVPVGAVVVRDGAVIGAGHNLTRTARDPSAHAEMMAIRAAAAAVGDWRLLECTLYVTLEPCAMCAGAIVLSRLPRLVFSAYDPKAGMCGSLENLVQDPRLNHRVELAAGVLAEEGGALLRDFFRARREAGKSAPGEPGQGPPLR
jgi:tRNA(adenine34) deaminase